MDRPLKLLRAALELTQAEFGEAIGVSAGRICQVENSDQERLGSDALLELADRYRVELARLGLTVEDLMRGSRAGPATAA